MFTHNTKNTLKTSLTGFKQSAATHQSVSINSKRCLHRSSQFLNPSVRTSNTRQADPRLVRTTSLFNIRLVPLDNTILASVNSSNHQYTNLIPTTVTSLESAIDGRIEAASVHSQQGDTDEGHAHFLSVLDECLQIFGHPSRITSVLPEVISPQIKPVEYNQYNSRPVSPLENWGAYPVPFGQPYFVPQQYQQPYFVPQQYQQPYFVEPAFQYNNDFPALPAAPHYQQ